MKYRFLPEAAEEFDGALDFYDAIIPGLGIELFEDFEKIKNRLLLYPESASPHLLRTRKAVLIRFPYNIIYRLTEEEIVIIAFMHQKQKPGYWKKRNGNQNL